MDEHHEKVFRKKFFVSLLLSVPVLAYSPFISGLLGFTPPELPFQELITPGFSTAIFLYGGLTFLKMSKNELVDRKPGMMTLISLGISVSYIYSVSTLFISGTSSFFWELVTLIDVMLLGHWIEMRSVRRASGALEELAELMPDTAIIKRENGETEEVKVSELENGDIVVVRPGSSVPADGKVLKGNSTVNESMITGESKPVEKNEGDEVIGGTINNQGSLEVEVTATGDETALAGIMNLVKEAEESKSNTQLLADKAAGWLFYIAVGFALVTGMGWTVAEGFGVFAVERIVTVLVTACPHALGLAIPLVVAINTSISAKNGILVRDRRAMEKSREIDYFVFDKTGTLTLGEQRVVNHVSEEDEKKFFKKVSSLEKSSEHVIAEAVRKKIGELGVTPFEAENFQSLKGKGVEGKVQGKRLTIGNEGIIRERTEKISRKYKKFIDEESGKGRTSVLVEEDGKVIGGFSLADQIRPESFEAVEKLHQKGFEVAMVTGDSEKVAKSVAEELGIDKYFAEVLPQDKEKTVKQLQEEGKKVAMTGDGVNDAPALVRADVGIAVGSGTDVAVESADIVLVKNNPLDIVKILKISERTRSKMVQNLFWATGYNVFALPLAAGILYPVGFVLSPAWGAFIMSLSTVIVALNAQLLRNIDL